MTTYRRKKKRVKINHCSNERNNKIVASNQVALVLNDLGMKSNHSSVSRYLIFKEKSRIRTVHILTFVDDTIKNNFYNTFNFHTVPIIKLSEILNDAKAWVSANKTSRSYGGGNGSNGGTRVMRYMDVDNKSIEESDIPIRDIDDGGIYIEEGEIIQKRRRRRAIRMVKLKYSQSNPSDVIDELKVLATDAGVDIDRIYIINKQTNESKWFKEAKESGDWINIWDYINENLTLDINLLVDSYAYSTVSTVCEPVAKLLSPLILDKNSSMLNLINMNGNCKKHLPLVRSLKNLGLWTELISNIKSQKNFEEVSTTAKESYPYLPFSCLTNENYATTNEVAKIAKYVNMSDAYEKLVKTDLLSAIYDVECNIDICDNTQVLQLV